MWLKLNGNENIRIEGALNGLTKRKTRAKLEKWGGVLQDEGWGTRRHLLLEFRLCLDRPVFPLAPRLAETARASKWLVDRAFSRAFTRHNIAICVHVHSSYVSHHEHVRFNLQTKYIKKNYEKSKTLFTKHVLQHDESHRPTTHISIRLCKTCRNE